MNEQSEGPECFSVSLALSQSTLLIGAYSNSVIGNIITKIKWAVFYFLYENDDIALKVDGETSWIDGFGKSDSLSVEN